MCGDNSLTALWSSYLPESVEVSVDMSLLRVYDLSGFCLAQRTIRTLLHPARLQSLFMDTMRLIHTLPVGFKLAFTFFLAISPVR